MRKGSSSEATFPENFSQILWLRHKILKKIREFFDNRGYLEVETPIRVKSPGIDPYIDAFPSEKEFFLITSPELHMKRLLSTDLERIYQITHAFRAEEEGHLHSSEFALLEWYRKGTDYLGIMQETEELLKSLVDGVDFDTHVGSFPFERIRVDEMFEERAGWKPSLDWNEDRYFIDWVEKIEPCLKSLNAVFLLDFPAPLAALARINSENPHICERFELYLDGIEIANAFSELTDHKEHRVRFEHANKKRETMGKAPYPVDEGFMESIKTGIPDCGGIAVGLDRLVMAIQGLKRIDLVQTFPKSRL